MSQNHESTLMLISFPFPFQKLNSGIITSVIRNLMVGYWEGHTIDWSNIECLFKLTAQRSETPGGQIYKLSQLDFMYTPSTRLPLSTNSSYQQTVRSTIFNCAILLGTCDVFFNEKIYTGNFGYHFTKWRLCVNPKWLIWMLNQWSSM